MNIGVNIEDNAMSIGEHLVIHEYLTKTFNDKWGYCKARAVHNGITTFTNVIAI